MTFLRRLFGLDFPDPKVGQVWRSRHSGRCMRVTDVHTMDTGPIVVSVITEDIAIGQTYAHGLDQWRWRLREEARELIEGVPMEPSRPWPRGGNLNPPPNYPRPPTPPGPPQWKTPGPAGFTPPPPAPPRPGPELICETIEQREEVCAAWHELPDELRRDPRMTRLYRALGGVRMDEPSASGFPGVMT